MVCKFSASGLQLKTSVTTVISAVIIPFPNTGVLLRTSVIGQSVLLLCKINKFAFCNLFVS
jgi:hypothetical protein